VAQHVAHVKNKKKLTKNQQKSKKPEIDTWR